MVRFKKDLNLVCQEKQNFTYIFEVSCFCVLHTCRAVMTIEIKSVRILCLCLLLFSSLTIWFACLLFLLKWMRTFSFGFRFDLRKWLKFLFHYLFFYLKGKIDRSKMMDPLNYFRKHMAKQQYRWCESQPVRELIVKWVIGITVFFFILFSYSLIDRMN